MKASTSANLAIDEGRFRRDLEALAAFGQTSSGGVSRPAFSPAHLEAREWFVERGSAAGFDTSVDGAGNHSVILSQPGVHQTLLLGSHLDSVPQGGRYDGALGVLSALETLRTVKEAELVLPVNLEAVDFTDEESRYIECWGSRALTGQLQAGEIQRALEEHDELADLMSRAGLTERGVVSCGRDPQKYAGYLELHIEQGPRLEQAGADLGIVTGVVGIWAYRFQFLGRAGHTGTTPMESRSDAGLGASAFSLACHQMVLTEYPECVGCAGAMDFDPGAMNVIPGNVNVLYEFRCPAEARGLALDEGVRKKAVEAADRFGLTHKVVRRDHAPATDLDPEIQKQAEGAAAALGLTTMRMASGAGHDAQIMADFTPAGLIFVPSVGGVSHRPDEFTRFDDCVQGANALLHTALRLVS